MQSTDKQRVVRNSVPNKKSQIRTSQDKDKTKDNNKSWFRTVNTIRQRNSSHFQKTLKEKFIPPLQVAETRPAWLWQAAADDRRVRCQMVTRSAETGTKSPDLNLQQSSTDIRPYTWNPKGHTKIEQPDECFRGVGPAGLGWHPPAALLGVGGLADAWKGRSPKGPDSRSAHCPSGCSWDPAAEVEPQEGNDTMTLTLIGWKHDEELGKQKGVLNTQTNKYFNIRIIKCSFDELYFQETAVRGSNLIQLLLLNNSFLSFIL